MSLILGEAASTALKLLVLFRTLALVLASAD
jgi:hypothetical protein